MIIKLIEDIAKRWIEHDDGRVFRAVAIELLKHLLEKYEKDLTKDDILKVLLAFAQKKHD